MYSQTDILQIQQKGITLDQVNNQLNIFKKGVSFLTVTRPAGYNQGIFLYNSNEVEKLVMYFKEHKNNHSIAKFVPASGAATRMFKGLYEFLEEPQKPNSEADKFEEKLNAFAFYNDLKNIAINQGVEFEKIPRKLLVELLLQPKGLNYGNLPKGLLKFHKYEDYSRVPVEEHLVEGALYAQDKTNEVTVHFTISPEHIQSFNELIKSTAKKYEAEYAVKYHITYSIQKSSTDTVAADNQNKPFRDKEGKLVFRPGGHGALLENLNDLNSDIIFIKNIDNVVPDRLKPVTTEYKNAIAGLLLQTQYQIATYLKALEKSDITNELVVEIKEFIETNLGYIFPESFSKLSLKEKSDKLFEILNRPLRVCGMVKNSGEPGGGPFWVQSKDGSQSLQILESSQFDLDDEEQRNIFKKASHFNPVDLVVYTKDYKGNKFDLTRYSDPDTGFISLKSKDGKELKALELPGLWNGAMANWSTIFVEVPVLTFNPVKTVIDLLRDEHKA